MPEPMYSETTERVYYDRIPQIYRREDAFHNWQFKKYIASITEQHDDISVLVERFRYTPPDDLSDETKIISDLVNPQTADEAWLPWLAQLVGTKLLGVWTAQQKRDAIANSIGGTQAGTKAAMAIAAQTVLTGTKTVYIHSFSNTSGGIGAGTQWEMLILTLPAETAGDVVAAVVNAGAKPAGIKLWHDTFGSDWTATETNFATWAVWDASTWDDIEQFGS